ncbi:MAG: peptidoglycan DD-metalloendopeptidase family protein [Proteobacteria bacterium]|nr:peptidoglycan DD-metalloendopeptidase family protein [Pseudomonadota bacterium]
MKKHYLLFAVLFGAQLCAPTIAAWAATSSDLAAVQAQLKRVEQQNKTAEANVKKSDATVEKTKQDLVSAAGKVDKLEVQRSVLTDKIAELEKRRAQLAASINANRDRMANAAAGLLVISSNPTFATSDAKQYVLTSALLTGVSAEFDSEMKTAAAQIEELGQVQEQKKAEQEKLAGTLKKYGAEKEALDKLLRSRTAQNEKLRSQQYALAAQMRELSARAKNLSELMAGVGSSELSADTSFSARRLNAPVSGRLVAAFGDKSALGLISDGWSIKTRPSALVTAPADGVVKFADSFKGYSRVLILSHKNGYNSVMAGLAETNVVLGQEVLAGEPVGRMGDAGKSGDRPEMYLEVRRGKGAVDPARLFFEPD